jgi:hypothetical protein
VLLLHGNLGLWKRNAWAQKLAAAVFRAAESWQTLRMEKIEDRVDNKKNCDRSPGGGHRATEAGRDLQKVVEIKTLQQPRRCRRPSPMPSRRSLHRWKPFDEVTLGYSGSD